MEVTKWLKPSDSRMSIQVMCPLLAGNGRALLKYYYQEAV